MATGLVKCNKASLCYRKHKRETLKSKRKAIIVGERNNTPMEHLQYCVTSPSKTFFPKLAMSRLWALLVRIEQRLGKESLKELKMFSFLSDKMPHIISNQYKLFFFSFSHFLKHEIVLENIDIREKDKIPLSVWLSLGKYFLLGCGIVHRE